ncbi:imidazole glycerol phosphate synthase subunit HisH, partial [Fulvivirga sp. RKSG066]|uniref:imidazole glycerol phosphate synthase subunit HisH n=1 Tax=Fulvivirga aurantia TaxID=2529383 RepID=UPI0012BC6662
GIEPILTDDWEELQSADRVIFPGVGEASTTMQRLNENKLSDLIKGLKQPVLGICLGMQLMCKSSEEGNAQGMGIFDVDVKRFKPENGEKVPHMGWNDLSQTNGSWITNNIEDNNMYFVHSYYVPLCEFTAAQCDYILPFSAALQKDNFYATQFHPEKSDKQGEQLLKNFIELP